MDYLEGLLQDLSSASDSSSGEDDESGGDEGKKEEEVDEDDQAERDKLPLYASRFKVLGKGKIN